jgi:hypothetical protein
MRASRANVRYHDAQLSATIADHAHYPHKFLNYDSAPLSGAYEKLRAFRVSCENKSKERALTFASLCENSSCRQFVMSNPFDTSG